MNLARQFPPHLLPGEFTPSPGMAIVAGVCPCNMFGGGSSKSSQASTDQRVAASEGSLAVGAGGKFIESGGLDISGSTNPEVGGTKLNAGGDISVSSSDPDVLIAALEVYNEQGKAALAANRDLSLSSTSAFSSYAKQLQEEKTEDLETLLKALGNLEETTDEQAQQRKTFLYLVLGILALLAALFIPWRRIRP